MTAVLDDAPIDALYRVCSSEQLRKVRTMLQEQRDAALRRPTLAAARASVAFYDARLALIAQILSERGLAE